MTPFDFLKCVVEEKRVLDFSSDEIKKSYDKYMMNRFVSMRLKYLFNAVPMVMFPNVPNENHYKYYLNCLPKEEVFFNYIKKKSNKNITVDQEECLLKYFECGTNDLKDIIQFLNEDQVNEICDKYKYGKTE